MQRLVRFRKAFYEKQNDHHQHNNKRKEPPLKHDHKNYLSVPQTSHAYLRCIEQEKIQKNENITAAYYNDYGNELLEVSIYECKPPLFLHRHQIDGLLRARMLDWMIQVTSSYKFTNKSYFDGASLMDRYFNQELEVVYPTKLHIIGVQCMTIASKMNEVFPLKMKTVHQKIAHKKFTVPELVDMELKIMNVLDYQLNSWTFFDVMTLKLSQYAFQQEQKKRTVLGQLFFKNSPRSINNKKGQNKEDQIKKLEEVCSYLGKFALYDYQFYCQTTMLMLAETVLSTAFEVLGIIPPDNIFASSPILMELCKQKFIKIIKHYRQRFNGLSNIFKFTSKEIISSVEELLTY